MNSFHQIMKSKLLRKRKNITPFNYHQISKIFKNKSNIFPNDNVIFVPKENNIKIFSNSNLGEIEKILMKYILNNESNINNTIHAEIISNYLFNSKKLQSFILLNELTLEDFIPIVLKSKIILCQNGNCIYQQGDEYSGFYALLKGNIKIKVSKLNYILDMSPEYKEEILKEYNLDKSEVTWINNRNNNNNNNSLNKKNNNRTSSVYLHNSSIFNIENTRRNSFRNNLILFSRKSINNLNNEYSTEKELFIYNKRNDLNNDKNETLLFGGINLFNEYMTEKSQIHLSSVYSYSNEESNNLNYINNDINNFDTILLYFKEKSLKDLREKIKIQNKLRIKFLRNKLLPIIKMSTFELSLLISNIKLIYIHHGEKKDFHINNNIFFLMYKGECFDDNNKDIIYAEGDFVYLNNIFGNNNNIKVSLNSKLLNSILFQIDLSILPRATINLMKKFLANIYEKQIYIRIDCEINKIKSNFNNEEKQIEEIESNNKRSLSVKSNLFFQNKFEQYNNKNSCNPYISIRNHNSIESIFLNSFDKSYNNHILIKNNSSSNLVNFRYTKMNYKKLFISNNTNNNSKRSNNSVLNYYSKNKSNIIKNNIYNNYNKYNYIYRNNNYKNISTKNSTYSKIKINLKNNYNPNKLKEYSIKVKKFNINKNTSKSEIIKFENNIININFLSNSHINNNIISSIISSKERNINNNYINYIENSEYNEYNFYNKKKLLKNHFNKNIFLNNIQKNLNI